MRTRSVALLATAALLAGGCHAKFKKHAPGIDRIDVQVLNTGGPYVQLGKAETPVGGGGMLGALGDVAAAAVNVSQTVKEVNQTGRIANAVQIDHVNAALSAGLGQALGQGPPFAYVDGDGDATLQLEILSYGLFVPFIGAPGAFTYTVRARMYEGTERVYSHLMTCEIGAGTPGAGAVALDTVNNVKQLKEMSDADIDQAFTEMASFCGGQFVAMMRRHAS